MSKQDAIALVLINSVGGVKKILHANLLRNWCSCMDKYQRDSLLFRVGPY
jgi:hypothetical protein